MKKKKLFFIFYSKKRGNSKINIYSSVRTLLTVRYPRGNCYAGTTRTRPPNDKFCGHSTAFSGPEQGCSNNPPPSRQRRRQRRTHVVLRRRRRRWQPFFTRPTVFDARANTFFNVPKIVFRYLPLPRIGLRKKGFRTE